MEILIKKVLLDCHKKTHVSNFMPFPDENVRLFCLQRRRLEVKVVHVKIPVQTCYCINVVRQNLFPNPFSTE